VSFKESVHVNRYLKQWTRNTRLSGDQVHISDIWYGPVDYKAMVARDIAMYRFADKMTSEDTTLGLETKSYRARRRQRMEEAKCAVLMEQATQLERNEAYVHVSEVARSHALSRGVKLAKALSTEDSRHFEQAEAKFCDLTVGSPTSTAEVNFVSLPLCLMGLQGPIMDAVRTDARWTDHGKSAASTSAAIGPHRLPIIPTRR
jgi:hypothetical protein